jgi:hypothetical protein
MSDVDMEFTISERVVSDTPILDPIRKPTTDAIVALAAALPNVPSVKGLTVRLGRFNGAYWDRFASEVLAAMPGWRLLPADAVPDAERKPGWSVIEWTAGRMLRALKDEALTLDEERDVIATVSRYWLEKQRLAPETPR